MTTFNMTTATNYLKTKYGEAGNLIYNGSYAFTGMLEKDYDWKGGNFEEPVELSIGVGVGSGATLPTAGVEKVEKVSFADKNMYARARIANKLIEKAVGGESAFIDAQKHKWERTQKGFAWNVERAALNGLANGSLGTIDTGGVSGSNPTYVCVVSAATWKQFNFEVGIIVNVAAGSDKWVVSAINPSTRAVTLTREGSGSQTPAQGELIYMQNSNGTDILSAQSVLKATSSTLYGVNVQYRWQAHQQLSLNTSIDEELLDNMVLGIEANCGEGIDYIFTSQKQWKILKSQNQNLKRYQVSNPNVPDKFAARLGFTALEYFSPVGSKVVPIMYSRFIEDDTVIGINKRKARLKHTNKPRWFERDGTVFLRTPDDLDELEARYYSYMELFLYPTFHGIVTGLT